MQGNGSKDCEVLTLWGASPRLFFGLSPFGGGSLALTVVMDIGTFSWWYSTYLMGRHPSVEQAFFPIDDPPHSWISTKSMENGNVLYVEIWPLDTTALIRG